MSSIVAELTRLCGCEGAAAKGRGDPNASRESEWMSGGGRTRMTRPKTEEGRPEAERMRARIWEERMGRLARRAVMAS